MIIKLNDILRKFSCTALIIREKLSFSGKTPIASWHDHKKVDERRTPGRPFLLSAGTIAVVVLQGMNSIDQCCIKNLFARDLPADIPKPFQRLHELHG